MKVRRGNDLRVLFEIFNLQSAEDLTTAENLSAQIISTTYPYRAIPCSYMLQGQSTVEIFVKGEDLIKGEYRVVVKWTKPNEKREPADEPFEVDAIAFEVVNYSAEVGGHNEYPHIQAQQVQLSAKICRIASGEGSSAEPTEPEAPPLPPLAKVATSGSYNDLSDTPEIPTVPSLSEWALSEEKPSYTAEEVGALPADTVIPTIPEIPTYTAGEGISISEDGVICSTQDNTPTVTDSAFVADIPVALLNLDSNSPEISEMISEAIGGDAGFFELKEKVRAGARIRMTMEQDGSLVMFYGIATLYCIAGELDRVMCSFIDYECNRIKLSIERDANGIFSISI